MNVWTVLETVIGAAAGAAAGGAAVGWAMVFGLSKHLGDRLLEGLKAQHSIELAEFAHERSVLLAEMNNAFSMGATSHMAEVAFDKYVEFSEKYLETMSEVLNTSIQKGARRKQLDLAPIFKIRQKWALWLTEDIERNLDQFQDQISRSIFEAPVREPAGEDAPIEFAIKSVTARLRKVLATEELAALRSHLVARSLKSNETSSELVAPSANRDPKN